MRLCVLFVAACCVGIAAWYLQHPPRPIGSPEGLVDLSGHLDHLRCEDDRCSLRLLEARADDVALDDPVRLVTDGDSASLPIGASVRLTAELRGTRAGANPGPAPPWAPARWWWRARAPPGGSAAVVDPRAAPRLALRDALRRRLDLPDQDSTAIYRALLLGDRSELRPSLRDAFADAGAAHLLAISGLHLGVVTWGLYRVLLWLLLWWPRMAQVGRAQVPAAALALGAAAGYVAVIRPSQATLRALVVVAVVAGAIVLARRAHPVRALLVAALALLVVDPSVALGASFQLSFAAAGALVVGMPRCNRALRVWLAEPGRLPGPGWVRAARWMALAAAVCALTWAATAPLALAWFGQLAPAGLVTNLIAVPLVSLIVVPCGMIWLILTLVAPPLAAWLEPLPVASAGVLLDLVEQWAELAGPATAGAWPHALGLLAAGLVVLAPARPRLAAIVAPVVLAVALWPAPAALTLTALDVGHGDALLLGLPDGRHALIDTGGSRRSERGDTALARGDLLPALTRLGAGRLELLIVTHADRDHVGAGRALAERLSIGELWLPPCDAAGPAVAGLARAVAGQGGVVRWVRPGAPFELGGATFEVLWPPPGRRRADGTCRGRRNDASLVLAVSWAGRRILLAADVEAPAELALLERGARLTADVLKVAHHGSRTSTLEPWLDAVAPAVAVVSGVLRAGPMPPHPDVLERLHRRGVATFVTGRDGAVRVTIEADGSLGARPRWGAGWRSGGLPETVRPP